MENIFPIKIIKDNLKDDVTKLLTKRQLQIGIYEKETTAINYGEYVILDFGKEISGGVRILTSQAMKDKKIRIRFGESVTETCSEIGEKNSTNDHSTRDFYATLQSYSDMSFGNSGFRFVRIDCEKDSSFQIKNIVAVSNLEQRKIVGSFECNDQLVNKIWETASYTLSLCMNNGMFWDGVKRDRLVWIGDLYPEFRASNCLFGEVEETDNSLSFAESETPLDNWMGWIPNYNVWWLLILCENYIYFRDKEKFLKHVPYAKEVIKNLLKNIDENGQTHFQSDFVDWATNYVDGQPINKKYDSNVGTYYLLKIAFNKIKIAFTDNNVDISDVEEILNRLSKRQVKVSEYKQIAGLGVLAGDYSENNKEILLKGGAKGLSTFMSYPILTAMARMGEQEKALSDMKEYYGKMLELGATTFWEDFDITWANNVCKIDEFPLNDQKDIHGDFGNFCYKGYRHSLCHGWSAGVIAYLIECVAGIKVDDKGEITVQPNLSGLKWIKVTYPTKNGVITVERREK